MESVEEHITSKCRDILWNLLFEQINDQTSLIVINEIDITIRDTVEEYIELSVGNLITNHLNVLYEKYLF